MARELIDRKQIHYTWWQHPDGTFSDGVTLQSVIHGMPTIDAVEVVRCKDCRHRYLHDVDETYYCANGCGLTDCVKPDDFCSHGERK